MENKISIRNFSLLIALLLIWALFAMMSDTFLGPRNLSQLSIELAITATLALGMLVVLLPGLIDLSVGSGVGLIGGIASVLVFQFHLPAPAAMGIGVLVAVVIWSLMGTLIVRQHVPSFIITLGGLLIFKGLFWLVIQNSTIPVTQGSTVNLYAALTTYYLPAWFAYLLGALIYLAIAMAALRRRKQRIAHHFQVEDKEMLFFKLFITFQGMLLFIIIMNQFRGVPLSVVILGVVAFLIHMITQHTPFGRHLYAIGGNEEAAVLSGIPIQKTIIGAFAIMGAIVALTGFMQTAYAGASTTTIGDLMELDAIAACVIGGTSLKGGRGKVLGVLFGALIMASLLNGMTLMAVSPELKFVARGTVLVLAVWMDVKLARDAS